MIGLFEAWFSKTLNYKTELIC